MCIIIIIIIIIIITVHYRQSSIISSFQNPQSFIHSSYHSFAL